MLRFITSPNFVVNKLLVVNLWWHFGYFSVCGQGEFLEMGTTCTPCPIGTFQSNPSHVFSECTNCTAGESITTKTLELVSCQIRNLCKILLDKLQPWLRSYKIPMLRVTHNIIGWLVYLMKQTVEFCKYTGSWRHLQI